jgi:malate dehydrogenase (oxaloacetate-decarboxylating)
LADALIGADAFVGVSAGNILTAEMVQSMASDSIVFALANPIPEGDPEMLMNYARIVATGRSDFPNQINNALSFPGIFRGALDVRAKGITVGMRLAAANGLASVIPIGDLSEEYIVPSVFNRDVVPTIARFVAQAAKEAGIARRESSDV